jgi:hypothetical protein
LEEEGEDKRHHRYHEDYIL